VFTPLTGRPALVTGGTRGIGKGIARVLASAGATVAISGRDAAVGEAAAQELSAEGGDVVFVPGDVATPEGCEGLVADAIERLGGLDVLCANAGVFPRHAIADLDAAAIDEIFAVNVRGTLLVVRHAVEALSRSGRGRVILTSSITGPITGYPGWSHYGATKAAQLGFMRSAAIELAPRGITVNAVLPGNIVTEGLADMGDDYLAGMTAAIPHARLGTPEEIGHACLFFATEEAGYVTGQALAVDGGQVLPESPDAVAP
jgi:3-oxoacyl-[acyl-carrier protein] reductase